MAEQSLTLACDKSSFLMTVFAVNIRPAGCCSSALFFRAEREIIQPSLWSPFVPLALFSDDAADDDGDRIIIIPLAAPLVYHTRQSMKKVSRFCRH